jgi:serine/threonine protein phosphatase 1
MEKIIAIGDIHGAFEELKMLLDMINPSQEDILIFLGDYIDRGHDSRGVIEYLVELKKKYPHWIFLAGNHEVMLLDYLSGNKNHYLFNGGESCLRLYRNKDVINLPDEHIFFINSLQLYYESENAFFVHAGVRPELELINNSKEDYLWIREDFIHSSYAWSKKIIFGHTPFVNPLVMENKVGIDTHAFKSGILTGYDPNMHIFYQTKPISKTRR